CEKEALRSTRRLTASSARASPPFPSRATLRAAPTRSTVPRVLWPVNEPESTASRCGSSAIPVVLEQDHGMEMCDEETLCAHGAAVRCGARWLCWRVGCENRGSAGGAGPRPRPGDRPVHARDHRKG